MIFHKQPDTYCRIDILVDRETDTYHSIGMIFHKSFDMPNTLLCYIDMLFQKKSDIFDYCIDMFFDK